MKSRWIKLGRGAASSLVACAISTGPALCWAQPSPLPQHRSSQIRVATSPENFRSAEQFRSAAALQNRGLYDLAAAEWAALLNSDAAGPLASEARFHRGECLFQMEMYADAAAEFDGALAAPTSLDHALLEQARVNLGLAHYNAGRALTGPDQQIAFDAAVAAFDAQLQRFPEGPYAPQAVFYRAEIDYARGRLAAAIEGYRLVSNRDAHQALRAQALYALGVALYEHNQPAEAALALEQLSDQFPDDACLPDAHLRLVEAQYAQALAERREGKLADAHFTLSRLLSTFPHHERARSVRLLRAVVRFEQLQYAVALDDVRALLASKPPQSLCSQGLLVRGMCLAALDRNAEAIETFERLLGDDAEFVSADRVLYELAWAYAGTKQPERSTDLFKRLATTYPNSKFAAESWFCVGESQYAENEFAAAADSFGSAQALAKSAALSEKAAHRKAWAWYAQARYVEAGQAFAEQLSLFPAGTLADDARVMMAESRFARGDYAAAFDAYRTALASDACRPDLLGLGLLHAAQTANQLDKSAECLEWLSRCERASPDNVRTAEIRCERGWAYYHQEQWDAARREFEFVVSAKADALGARARFMLGEIQVVERQYDEAVRTFLKVAYGYGDVQASPELHRWQAEALFEAARCLEHFGRSDSARRLYRELLTYYPECAKAAQARVALRDLTTR